MARAETVRPALERIPLILALSGRGSKLAAARYLYRNSVIYDTAPPRREFFSSRFPFFFPASFFYFFPLLCLLARPFECIVFPVGISEQCRDNLRRCSAP